MTNEEFAEELKKPPKKAKTVSSTSVSLDDVIDSVEEAGRIIVMHTQPGWGKTSTFANIGGNIFMLTDEETGLLELMRNGQVGKTPRFPNVLNSWADITVAVKELIVKDHKYRMLTIDTFTGAIRLKEEELTRDKYNNDPSKFALFGGTQSVKDTIAAVKVMMRDLRKLAEKKGMTIVLLCHSSIKKFKNPDDRDYDRWEPDMHREVWAVVNRLADAVLFGTYEVFVQSAGKDTDMAAKGKAKGSGTRLIKTEWNPSYDAKNRCGMTPSITCGRSAKETARLLATELSKNTVEETLEEHPDGETEEEEAATA